MGLFKKSKCNKADHREGIYQKVRQAILAIHKARQDGIDSEINKFIGESSEDVFFEVDSYENTADKSKLIKRTFATKVKKSLLSGMSGDFGLNECEISLTLGLDDDGGCQFHKDSKSSPHSTMNLTLKFKTDDDLSAGNLEIQKKLISHMETHVVSVEEVESNDFARRLGYVAENDNKGATDV